jgi:hypothetical protein
VDTENHLVPDYDYMGKPRYLEAITRNNSPRPYWGPKKKVNHYGRYAHLNALDGHNGIPLNSLYPSMKEPTTGVINENYQDDNISGRSSASVIRRSKL